MIRDQEKQNKKQQNILKHGRRMYKRGGGVLQDVNSKCQEKATIISKLEDLIQLRYYVQKKLLHIFKKTSQSDSIDMVVIKTGGR